MYLRNIVLKSRNIIFNSLQRCKFSINNHVFTKETEKSSKFTLENLSNFKFFKRTKISEETYKMKDKVPPEFDLVYRCTMERYFIGTQIMCSIMLSVIVVTALTSTDITEYKIPEEEVEFTTLDNVDDQMQFFLSGLLIINAALLYFVTKFPLRVYLNPKAKNYLAVSFNGLPLQTSTTTFGIGELKSRGHGMLPWKEFTYKMKNGKTIILLDQYFRRPYDLNVMMGHTKL